MRLVLGWSMIAIGSLGMVVTFWLYTSWLWYELRREKEPFWSWFKGMYSQPRSK